MRMEPTSIPHTRQEECRKVIEPKGRLSALESLAYKWHVDVNA